jgi:anthranilate/para-aminobenzoate synthase component I
LAFATQTEAKAFLVSKVAAQAAREGAVLSEAEQYMLSWSESDPDFTPRPELAEALQAEMSDQQYEAKVAGLLRRAFETGDESEQNLFREAQAKLKEGDHYILVMAEDSIPSAARPWWRLW